MKIKIISMMGLLLVPTISLGAVDTLSRGDELAFHSKAPVGQSFDEVDSEVGLFSKGYEGDQESDEGAESGQKNMRSSGASTPDADHKPFQRFRRSARKKFTEALKEKAKETMGAFKSRLNDSAINFSEEEVDSDYESHGFRTDQSLSPVNEGAEEILNTLSQLQASGLSAEDQLKALTESLKKKVKVRSSSVPPALTRQESERRQARFDRRKARSDNRHDRPFGGRKNESEA
jgi:hypothetical protein